MSYVLVICLYTLILKTIVLPLFVIQQKSTRRMGEMSPKIKILQEKYKNDPKKMQEEQMKLYKELGVNPMKGCLPLLAQMPIFIAMFTVISSYQFTGSSFLWIPDISKPDPFYILAVLTGVVQFLSVKVMAKNMDAEQQKMQNKMGIMMSVMFIFICLKYKAALAIYFIASSVIQTVQSLVVSKYLKKVQDKEDAIKAEKEQEKSRLDAQEREAKRADYKKKKKKKIEEQGDSAVDPKKINCETAADADKPKRRKKKKTDDGTKTTSDK
ncbi:MAG: YidC/Oxa1 family membrane protein insertase [Clostridium sp.]